MWMSRESQVVAGVTAVPAGHADVTGASAVQTCAIVVVEDGTSLDGMLLLQCTTLLDGMRLDGMRLDGMLLLQCTTLLGGMRLDGMRLDGIGKLQRRCNNGSHNNYTARAPERHRLRARQQ